MRGAAATLAAAVCLLIVPAGAQAQSELLVTPAKGCTERTAKPVEPGDVAADPAAFAGQCVKLQGWWKDIGFYPTRAEAAVVDALSIVLLDNRRTELLADAEQRDALHCIRCGACLNVCPIFRNVGGHTYGTTY